MNRAVIAAAMTPDSAMSRLAAARSSAMSSAWATDSVASDPLTLAAVAATLALVALMATLVPAYRALRLDPVKVLRAA